jgi:hypothetical protein
VHAPAQRLECQRDQRRRQQRRPEVRPGVPAQERAGHDDDPDVPDRDERQEHGEHQRPGHDQVDVVEAVAEHGETGGELHRQVREVEGKVDVPGLDRVETGDRGECLRDNAQHEQ